MRKSSEQCVPAIAVVVAALTILSVVVQYTAQYPNQPNQPQYPHQTPISAPIPTNPISAPIPTKPISQSIPTNPISQPNQYPNQSPISQSIPNIPSIPNIQTNIPTYPNQPIRNIPTNPQYPNQPNQYRGENSHRTFRSRGLDHSLRCLVARAPTNPHQPTLTLTPPNRGLSARAHHAHSLDPLTPSLPYPSISLQATLVTYPPIYPPTYLSKPAARRLSSISLSLSLSLSRTIPRSLAPPT